MTNRTLLMLLLWFIIILIAMAGLFYLAFCTDNAYYTRVDNGLVSEITPRSGMSYRYELPAYDKKGHVHMVNFETSRILREGAYLRLNVAPIRGVISWEEVQPTDIPDRPWNLVAQPE